MPSEPNGAKLFQKEFFCPSGLEVIDVAKLQVRDNTSGENRTAPYRKVGTSFTFEDFRRNEQYYCENDHIIPKAFLEFGLISIGLLGPSRAMKSHWVGVATREMVRNQILDRYSPRVGVQVMCDSDTEQDLNSGYWDHLYGIPHRRILATQPIQGRVGGKPLMFKTMKATTSLLTPSKPHDAQYICIYDHPGEKLRKRDDMVEFAPALFGASGLLVFISVASIMEIVERLPAGLVPRPEEEAATSAESVAIAAEGLQSVFQQRELRTPVAVVVSRADLLHHIEEYKEAGHLGPYGSDGSRAGAAPLRHPESHHRGARSFVESYAKDVFQAIDYKFHGPVQYFFASATNSSLGESDIFPSFAPWGCVEPLAWLLDHTGFLS